MKPLLLVFCKNALLGQVKTRLAATIGEVKALALYEELLAKTARVVTATGYPFAVWYTPSPQADPLWQALTPHCYPQPSGDLGARMQAAFTWAFDQGYTHVVGIGSDLWTLEASDLQQAVQALQTHEVVLGPAQDGGYYLIGKKQLIPALFQNKKWSTAEVLPQTLADLHDKAYYCLPSKNDIDTHEDLQKHPDLWKKLPLE